MGDMGGGRGRVGKKHMKIKRGWIFSAGGTKHI